MIIDNRKPEYKGLPSTINGEVLLRKDVDADGNIVGVMVIPAEHFKWLAENLNTSELAQNGYAEYMGLIQQIKNMPEIVPVKPDMKGI